MLDKFASLFVILIKTLQNIIGKTDKQPQLNIFQIPLKEFIDPKHELVLLTKKIIRDIFMLPITFGQYKEKFLLNIKAYLKQNLENKHHDALKLIKQSITINAYAYNLYPPVQLSNKLKNSISAKKYRKEFKSKQEFKSEITNTSQKSLVNKPSSVKLFVYGFGMDLKTDLTRKKEFVKGVMSRLGGFINSCSCI